MAEPIKNIRPYFTDVERFKLRPTLHAPPRGRFGDLLSGTISCATGGDSMQPNQVRVGVLGTSEDDAFYCSPELFIRSATQLGGEPVWTPPPFSIPCSDGLLIIYTLKSSGPDCVEVRGGYIAVPKETLEKDHIDTLLCAYWHRAQKPADMGTMLKHMGFGETRSFCLN